MTSPWISSFPGPVHGRHEIDELSVCDRTIRSVDGVEFLLEDPERVDHLCRLIDDCSRKRELMEVLIEEEEFEEIPGFFRNERDRALMEDETKESGTCLSERLDRF